METTDHNCINENYSKWKNKIPLKGGVINLNVDQSFLETKNKLVTSILKKNQKFISFQT